MSQLKQRIPKLGSGSDSDSDNDHPSTTTTSTINPNNLPPPPPPLVPPSQQSKGQRVISQTLASTAYLANLLPTGTLLAFQILTPVFTNNGQCDTVTRSLTAILLAMLAISCFLASFTDSLQGPDGQVYYGLATTKGMWLFDYPNSNLNPGQENLNLTKYKLRFIDWVHAVLSMFVFGVVALRDKNVVTCFAPTPSHEIQEVLDIVPIGVGLICSLLFVVFPTRRHGIGYPITPGRDDDK
ncbi:protein DMP3-like [Silene latifolia]|uniref:protein DMP3-like n=1 Tax=Silene latifolia TaxID=37657 RepID=UPI003D77C940